MYWEEYEKTGWNPQTAQEVTAVRRRLKVDLDLPMRDEYSAFVARFFDWGVDCSM